MSILIEPRCDFCEELSANKDHLYAELLIEEGYDAGDPSLNRILLQRGNLNLMVSLGELELGHLLICPSYHATAFNRILGEDRDALSDMLDIVENVFLKRFGCLPTYFEHGDPTGNNPSGANCVQHAHLHVVPRPFDLIANIEIPPKMLTSAKLHCLPEELADPYVLVADQNRNATLYLDENLPRQFLRRRYSELSGLTNRWNWGISTDVTQTLQSIKQLKTWFSQEES